MDESRRNPNTEAPPSYSLVMARALVSAAIFGVIGGFIGRWFGARANGDGSNMARPIMQWSMAGFWALLAAYCSTKASERADQTQLQPAPSISAAPSSLDMAPDLQVHDKKIPLSLVQSAGAELKGELAPSSMENQRA